MQEKVKVFNEDYKNKLAGEVWSFVFDRMDKSNKLAIHAAAGVASIVADSAMKMDGREIVAFEELMRKWGM